MNPLLEIRQPLAFRIYIVVITVVWSGAVLAGFVAFALKGNPGLIILGLMATFGLTFGYRMYSLGAVASEEELLAHNLYRTKRLRRSDIEGFRIGSAGLQIPFGKTIYALTRDGSIVPLDVLARFWLFARSRKKLESRMEELRNWLTR